VEIVDGIEQYMIDNQIENITELIGAVRE